MNTHTPTPWKVVPRHYHGDGANKTYTIELDGKLICGGKGFRYEHFASAACRAVNNHDALVAALAHAVNIAEGKQVGNWDDLLPYRALLAKIAAETKGETP